MKYTINIYQGGDIVRTYKTDLKAEAKRIYERNAEKIYQYTELVIKGRRYNIAQAERFFGAKGHEAMVIKI